MRALDVDACTTLESLLDTAHAITPVTRHSRVREVSPEADEGPLPFGDTGVAEDSEIQLVRAELARSRETLAQLRLDQAAASRRHRDAGSKGGRPRKIPADVHAELEALVLSGRTPREARSVLRRRYGCTSQGLGLALRRDAPKEAKAK